MASPQNRIEFKQYCLRRLGEPVIEVNVDDEQVEDRIDDALLYYQDYHYDGTETVYYVHTITSDDIGNGYVPLPDDLIGVSRIMDVGLFGGKLDVLSPIYQITAQAVWDSMRMTGSGLLDYSMTRNYLEEINSMFGNNNIPIRFNRHTDRIYLDWNWKHQTIGNKVILEGTKRLDSDVYSDIWADRWLQRYATALIKRQWGENVKLYEGVRLIGELTLNGQKIYDEAVEEINRLEEEMMNSYSLPVLDRMA